VTYIESFYIIFVCCVQVNYLLPLSQFIVHVSSLFKHDVLRVREKAHTLVNIRLRQLNAEKLNVDEVSFSLLL